MLSEIRSSWGLLSSRQGAAGDEESGAGPSQEKSISRAAGCSCCKRERVVPALLSGWTAVCKRPAPSASATGATSAPLRAAAAAGLAAGQPSAASSRSRWSDQRAAPRGPKQHCARGLMPAVKAGNDAVLPCLQRMGCTILPHALCGRTQRWRTCAHVMCTQQHQ